MVHAFYFLTIIELLFDFKLIDIVGATNTKDATKCTYHKFAETSTKILHTVKLQTCIKASLNCNWTLPLGLFRTNFTIFPIG